MYEDITNAEWKHLGTLLILPIQLSSQWLHPSLKPSFCDKLVKSHQEQHLTVPDFLGLTPTTLSYGSFSSTPTSRFTVLLVLLSKTNALWFINFTLFNRKRIWAQLWWLTSFLEIYPSVLRSSGAGRKTSINLKDILKCLLANRCRYKSLISEREIMSWWMR